MSNHLAIATVTASLQRVLQHSIQLDVEGASVTTVKPESLGGGVSETGVNLYLYHIKRNSAWGNSDLPARQRRGDAVKRNQIGIDLFYVITFTGNDNELEPQRLLGTTLKILEDRSVISPQIIRETIADSAFSYLADSDLDSQVEIIRTEFLSISTDELSKIWSVFFQTSYALSVVYKVTAVLIEGEEPLQRALPVRAKNFGLLSYAQQPIIQQVVADTGRYQPILTNSTLLIKGRKLATPGIQVRIAGQAIAPPTVRATEIRLPLSSIGANTLKAGVLPLQVGCYGEESDRASMVESNVFPFILRPSIVGLTADMEEVDEGCSGEIAVTLDVMVTPQQRVILLLNHRDAEVNQSYLFEARSRDEEGQIVMFDAKKIEPGEYLVRVQVDGAESVLEIDTNRASETFEQYIAPSIRIQI
ncbi:DUF4255 domain-containing protein [Pleurocapsales cyanobacterium LEGE 10410]|nr:DUF4255 domain-containing protein [Pleurocapsales cyanobacterium LEGE 10410]